MEGTREAEMIVSFSLQGINYLLRLSGAAATNIAAMIVAIKNQPDNSPGKKRLSEMLKSGEELRVFTLPKDAVEDFAREAKRYGIQYCISSEDKDTIDLMVKVSDASKINRVAEKLELGKVSGGISHETERTADEQVVRLNEVQKMMNRMFEANKAEKEQMFNENPSMELSGNPSGVSFNGTSRDSVREALHDINEDIDSTRDYFHEARSLSERIILPDGSEAQSGWEKPDIVSDEKGNIINYRGKNVSEMDNVDIMQYVVDSDMEKNGRLSESTITKVYVSGNRVNERGMVEPFPTNFNTYERQLIAQMMQKNEREKGEHIFSADILQNMTRGDKK